MGAGPAVLEHPRAGRRHAEDHRRGPRQVALKLHDGPGAAQELQALRRAAQPGSGRPAEEV